MSQKRTFHGARKKESFIWVVLGMIWEKRVSAHACSQIGQKWLLLFVLWDLRAVSCVAIVSGLFTVSALLEPAQVPYAAERQGHNRYRRV
jgi:hypothetical protein